MRLGCIDIGSNTTRLLVAECDASGLEAVHQERAFTRIGHELLEHGALSSAKIAEVVAVVDAQRQTAQARGVTSLRAVATEAIRSAGNGGALVAAIAHATGIEVEVLSAEEEARLAFVGAAGTLPDDLVGELGVVDVGGGSSELVVGVAPRTVRWWASVPIGSATLTHAHLHSDPPTAAELAEARDAVRTALAAFDTPPPGAALAVGGSATSLARVAGEALDARALEGALAMLRAAPASEIAARFAIDPQRARLLPGGVLVLAGAARAFGTALRVGRGGIREGVLLEAWRR